MERSEQLAALYLDGDAEPADREELVNLLRTDPGIRRQFLALWAQDRLLQELHRGEVPQEIESIMRAVRQDEPSFVASVMEQIRHRPIPCPRELWVPALSWVRRLLRPNLAWACLIGLLCLCFSLLAWRAPVGTPVLLAGYSKTVTIEREGLRWGGSAETKLQVNDLVQLGGTSSVVITYAPENTVLTLHPGTTLKLLDWHRGKRFELRFGGLEALVAHQRLFRSMLVTTPQAKALVVGTRFELVVTTNATRLDLEQGRVRFTRTADGREIQMVAGSYAVAGAGYEFAAQPLTGRILREYWTNLPGEYFVTALTSSPDFPAHPSGRDYLTRFEAPSHWGKNYGARICGYLHPPVTGAYTFWIAAGDGAELWLSPDDNPRHKQPAGFSDGEVPHDWTHNRGQQSASVWLVAGRKYYIESLQKQGTKKADHLSVAWQGPRRQREIIPGEFLSPFLPKPGKQSQ